MFTRLNDQSMLLPLNKRRTQSEERGVHSRIPQDKTRGTTDNLHPPDTCDSKNATHRNFSVRSCY